MNPSSRRPEAGFTLLEVLVALAVLAVGVTAAVQAGAGLAGRSAELDARWLATWVAADRIAEHRLLGDWPVTGEHQGEARQGGRRWYYREAVTGTADPDIRRIDIRVYADADRRREVGYLFGYLGRP